MGYYRYCRYSYGCGIIPMIDRIKRKFFGHRVNKHNVYHHYVTELTFSNVSFSNQTELSVDVVEKRPYQSISIEIIVLIILLLILLTLN